MTDTSSPMSTRIQMETVDCNLCGSTEHKQLFPDTRPEFPDEEQWAAFRCTHPGYGIHPPIVTCDICNLSFTNPRPRYDVIRDNYKAVEDPLYLQERVAREITFRHHLRVFERYTGQANGRRLLDVGSYIGVFVEEAMKTGWDAWGLEPSNWASEYAQQVGLQVEQGLLEEHPFELESFDALTMWDVIEHLTDPMEDLRLAYELLKPGGWIAVHTMDLNSLFARIMRGRWPWLMEMHVYYFTRQTLTVMMEKVGFQVKTVRPQGRYLRLKYLTTRLRPYSVWMADTIDRMAGVVGLGELALPINFGDLVTAFAQKPSGN